MTIYGYARVSTDGQSLASQDAQLHAADCAKVYSEKISGARSDRPELAKLLKRNDHPPPNSAALVLIVGAKTPPDVANVCWWPKLT